MKALRITDTGGPEVLRLDDVPEPVLGPSELRVQVRATGLNRADLLQCMGLYPAPSDAPADIPGLEYSGEVVAVGPRVRRFKPGDRVMGVVGGGAFAERVAVHEREAVAIPSGLDFARAAAIPEAFWTAFDALVLQAGLRAGESVLIHAAASGVGTAATQLASALGARVVGTSRSAAKLETCRRLGLAHPILVEGDSPLFEKAVRSATGGHGADVVLDLVSGTYLAQTLASCAPRARVMLVGLLAGARAQVDLGVVLRKRLTLQGTVLRSRPLEEKITLALEAERQLLPLFEAGRLVPVVDSVLPLGGVQEAFGKLSSNSTLGKVVVEWPRPDDG